MSELLFPVSLDSTQSLVFRRDELAYSSTKSGLSSHFQYLLRLSSVPAQTGLICNPNFPISLLFWLLSITASILALAENEKHHGHGVFKRLFGLTQRDGG